MKRSFIFFSLIYFFSSNLNSAVSALSNTDMNNILIPENLSKVSLNDCQNSKSSNFQNITSAISLTSEKLFELSQKVNTAFNFIADRIDTILTKKGAIKTLIMFTPIFILYCYFFPPEPVKNLISHIVGSTSQGASEILSSTVEGLRNNDSELKDALKELTREVGELQGIYNINYQIGETAGLWQGLWKAPISTLTLLTNKIVNMAISNGIPAIAFILA
ncbi:hypothetical protein GF322_05335, partial [Candidatus Dependentiae bacterium]|nr:hypothetical protein [Candidatus Dependentiae bacterium]